MEWLFLLAVVVLLVAILPGIGISKANAAQREIAHLRGLLQKVNARLERVEQMAKGETRELLKPTISPVSQPSAPRPSFMPVAQPVPPPLPPSPVPVPMPVTPDAVLEVAHEADSVDEDIKETVDVIPEQWRPRPPVAVAPKPKPPRISKPLDLERFMGVKLFSWIGGLALFLGIVFFVKYAFERNLISPELRVGMGLGIGLVLLAVGPLVRKLQAYMVLSQSLCATGVVTLYGVSYAAHAYYQLPLFNQTVTFCLLALITTAAFVLAVRLNALVVAVLGMLGGFLTPLAVSTGQDRPVALFGYIALLDIGLIAVAEKRPWRFLVLLAAAGTAIINWGWLVKFFEASEYHLGSKTFIPAGIAVGFIMLFLLALARRRKSPEAHLLPYGNAVLLLVSSGFLMSVSGLEWTTIGSRPWVVYGYVLVLYLASMIAAWLTPGRRMVPAVASLLIFLHLAYWSSRFLTEERMVTSFILYVAFGILSVAAPVCWNRLKPAATDESFPVTAWMSPLALVLLFLPLGMHPHAWAGFWVPVAMMNVIGLLVLKQRFGSLALLCSAVITSIMAVTWFQQLPVTNDSQNATVLLAGGFAAFFLAAAFLMRRQPGVKETPVSLGLMSLSVVLPFLLLILAMIRLPLSSPHLIFSAASVMSLLMLGAAAWQRQNLVPLICFGSAFLMELVWWLARFHIDGATAFLVWISAWTIAHFLFPFLASKRFANAAEPWIAPIVAMLAQYLLVYQVVRRSFPEFAESAMGLVPAVFAIITAAGLLVVMRQDIPSPKIRLSRLAWFAGALLFFITVIIPAQFRREWITLGWALEGTALVWLFRRLPHQGLRMVGIGLLLTAFARLVLNQEVLTYHERAGTPIWNWFLYIYGASAFAMLLAGRWLKPAQEKEGDVPWHHVLLILSGVTFFVLVNLEIADFYAEPGQAYLTIEFSQNLARDVTHSIAWGLFGLGCLILGFWRQVRGLRYAGLILLSITLLKLFLRDLANISSIYRIIALIGVAMIILIASFLYQRFFSREDKGNAV